MKKIYRKFINFIYSIPVFVETKKTLIYEVISILRKRKLYKNITWTREQQQEFDSYWKRAYGRKISNKWHKLYQSINGLFCIDYFPEVLYSAKLEPKLNSYNYCKVLADKNLLSTLYDGKIEGVRIARTYISSYRNLFFDRDNLNISLQEVENILCDIGEAVIKPTVDSSSGRDIRFLSIKNGVDKNTNESIKDIISQYKTNFIIQERIVQHSSLSSLYPNAVNTLRIITYKTDGKIGHTPSTLRVGSGGSLTDNIHAGGLAVGVSDSGICLDKAYVLGYCDNKTVWTQHPDTGIIFDGYAVPFVSKIIESAEKLHAKIPNIGILSWDFTVNEQDEIIIIETNCWGQSVWFPQIINGCSLFGNETENLLKLIAKH